MTTNIRLLAMAAVAMLAMNSCVKEENLNSGDKKGTPVEFEMGVNSVSRTSTSDEGYATTFVEGDEVGIFVYNGETPVVKNAHYKLNADGKWVAQGEAITAEEGVSYSYYAYYPYNAEATDATSVSLTVAGDQTTGYTGSDALMAKSESVAAGTTTVPLQYSHAFALVQVTLKGDLAAKDATVTLQNVYPTAALNLITGTAGEASGVTGTIAMKACSTNGETAPYNYRAIVPAQTITANNGILTTFSNGKNYKFTYSVDVPYESGKLRQFDVTLGENPAGTTIEIGEGTISNWEDSEGVEGGEGGVEEVVTPTTSLDLSTLINAEMSFVAKGTYNDEKLADANDYWFTRTSTITTVTFDNTDTAIKADNTTDRGSWNNTSFGYHCGTKVFEKTTYRLTFDVKSSIVGNQIIGVGVRNSDDKKGFRISNLNAGKRNLAAINFTQEEVTAGYKTITVDIDFTQASTTTNLIDNTFEGSVDSDLKGITILFFNNLDQSKLTEKNTFATYVKNIKIEKVTE